MIKVNDTQDKVIEETNPVCSGCGGEIANGSRIHEVAPNISYHTHCFKCFVCGEDIGQEGFYYDPFGNLVHDSHFNETERCISCGRFLLPGVTADTTEIEDGRFSCGSCSRLAVLDSGDVREPYIEALGFLKKQGISFNPTVPVHLISQRKFKEIYPSGQKTGAIAFANSTISARPLKIDSNIYICKGYHRTHFAKTLIHELIHCWIVRESKRQKLGDTIEEGFCNYMAYFFLEQKDEEMSRILMKRAMNNSDWVYGMGMKMMKKYVKKHSLENFLNDVKDGKKDFVF
ncbi:MAG: protein DA1 [Proteobacteria bacterium]|nr:protein DA1 [Pseudomonadota bacterium]